MSHQEKKRVLFRADGNSEIGLGHIYRSLAIAERLAANFDCYFAIRNPTNELINLIGNTCTLITIGEFENKEAEAISLATSVVPEIRADIVTLDGYKFDSAYQSAIKQHCSAKLISIDDDQPFHYTADIVINHAAGINADGISKEPYTKLCLGYKYLMLRKEFLKPRLPIKQHSELSSVLVCFGGADPLNITGKIVSCLLKDNSIGAITVILGASYEHIQNLREAASADARINLKLNLGATEMASLMQENQLAIVPASTVALEAFSMGLMLITGITAANQQNIYAGLLTEDTVYGIGDFRTLSCQELLSTLKETSIKYKHLSRPKQKHADGLLDLYKSLQ